MVGLSLTPDGNKSKIEITFHSIKETVILFYDDKKVARCIFDSLQKELHLGVL